jgi:hypothetical protein
VKKKLPGRIKWIWTSVILLLILIGSPFVALLNRAEPRICGLPFLYAAVLLIWIALCILLFLGYLFVWGDARQRRRGRKRGE